MWIDVVHDASVLVLVSVALFVVLGAVVRRRRPEWIGHVEKHRIPFLVGLLAMALAFKIGEDVLSGDSEPVDRGILVAIHRLAPAWLLRVMGWITLTGSSKCLFPACIAGLAWLGWRRHWREAALLASSLAGASGVIYFLKSLVARDRPALWETERYWGSSFPSGHTLATAAFATAVVLIVRRLKPAWHGVVVTVAFAWVAAVAASRLVLGVHWPSDVLAAACLGAFVALFCTLAINVRILNLPEKRPAK